MPAKAVPYLSSKYGQQQKEYPDKIVGNHFEHLQDGQKGKV
jgi:hypothetical protein